METKTQHRKPKFVYLEKPSQIRELVPGDLVSLAIGGGFGGQLYEFYAVYEGKLPTDFDISELQYEDLMNEHDSKSKTKGFSFLDLSLFQYLQETGSALRVRSFRVGNPEKDINMGGYRTHIDIMNYVVRNFLLNVHEYSQELITKKLELISQGEEIFKKHYTFDEVIIQDEYGNTVKKLKNAVVR